jgi:hypothetical protein
MSLFSNSQTRRNFFQTVASITLTTWIPTRWLNAAVAEDQKFTPPQDPLVLENSGIRAEFDPRNGALLSLVGKASGWHFQKESRWARTFSLLVPLSDRRNNPVVGMEQAPPVVEKSADGKRITFRWNGVTSQHGGAHDIDFIGIVDLVENGLSFSGEVDNRSALIVESVNWPCLGDVTAPQGEALDQLSRGYGTMNRDALLPKLTGSTKGYWGTENPVFLHAMWERFALAATPKQGFYCGIHDSAAGEFISFIWQQIVGTGPASSKEVVVAAPDPVLDKHLEFDVARLPYIRPGEKRTLVPVVLAHYTGTWHHGADIFKDWAKAWYQPAPSPTWIKDIHSWQQIQINSPEQEFRFPYSDLTVYAQDCARHGVNAIQLVGWNHGGQDGGLPFHDAEPQLGGAEALKQAIAKCQEMGVKIMLFCKFTWLDRTLPWFKQTGIQHAVKDPYGDPWIHDGYQYYTLSQWNEISTHHFSAACFNSPAYRDLACHEFEKAVDLGAAGMLYDEAAWHGGSNLCFDPTHHHPVPVDVFASDAVLASAFRKIAAQKNPEFAFAAEEGNDFLVNAYSLFYTRIGLDHLPLPRYLYQEIETLVAVGTGEDAFDDRDTINLCLMFRYVLSYEPYNFKGRLDQIPTTLAYGKRVDDFRRKYRGWLWDNVDAMDTLGSTVETDGPHIRHGLLRHRQTGRRALVIANQGRDGSSPVKVTARLESPAAGPLLVASPEHPDTRPTHGSVVIPPRSVVVIMES